jgi:hypothetical protein
MIQDAAISGFIKTPFSLYRHVIIGFVLDDWSFEWSHLSKKGGIIEPSKTIQAVLLIRARAFPFPSFNRYLIYILLNAWLPCWNGLLYSYLYP